MAAYLVRNRETKAIYGLFVAPNIEWLWDSVDEGADPSDYEWTRVARGGIYFPLAEKEYDYSDADDAPEVSPAEYRANSQKVPDDDYFYGPPLHVTTGEHLDEVIFGEKTKWTRFDHADEGVGMVAKAMQRAGRDMNDPVEREFARGLSHRMQLRSRDDA